MKRAFLIIFIAIFINDFLYASSDFDIAKRALDDLSLILHDGERAGEGVIDRKMLIFELGGIGFLVGIGIAKNISDPFIKGMLQKSCPKLFSRLVMGISLATSFSALTMMVFDGDFKLQSISDQKKLLETSNFMSKDNRIIYDMICLYNQNSDLALNILFENSSLQQQIITFHHRIIFLIKNS